MPSYPLEPPVYIKVVMPFTKTTPVELKNVFTTLVTLYFTKDQKVGIVVKK